MKGIAQILGVLGKKLRIWYRLAPLMKGIAQIRQKLQIMRLLQMQIATTMMMMAVIVMMTKMTSSTKNLYPFL